MHKPVLLTHDNLDDRREIHHLLARLPPATRVDFLRQACTASTLPGARTHPGVSQKTLALADLAQRDDSADKRLTLDIYMDLWYLSAHYDFDLDHALAQLVQLVRGRRQSWQHTRAREGQVAAVALSAFRRNLYAGKRD